MGLLGRYIDHLTAPARDRLIRAQDWRVGGLTGPERARCLLGHAEDWRPLAVEATAWRRWMDAETGDLAAPAGDAPTGHLLETACRPELFAFRRARPDDLPAYRRRLARWGWSSEREIGTRFDVLCARLGLDTAVYLVKRRAARDRSSVSAPPSDPRPAAEPRRAGPRPRAAGAAAR